MKPAPLSSLSPRTFNAITSLSLRSGLKLTTREEILKAVKNKTLHPSNTKAHSFGAKSLREVCDWLGLPRPISGQRIFELRSQLAFQLREQNLSLTEIATIMRFRGKEDSRRHIAHGERLYIQKVAAQAEKNAEVIATVYATHPRHA